MLPYLLRMQTLHYEVLDLDEQIVSLEADLKAEDVVTEALSWGQLSMDLNKIFLFKKENGNDHHKVGSTAPSLCLFVC